VPEIKERKTNGWVVPSISTERETDRRNDLNYNSAEGRLPDTTHNKVQHNGGEITIISAAN
jgi:hypothetical protein